jgi:diguanylate cyclase (GGDEF)-like protein
MMKLGRTRQKRVTRLPLEANESARFPVSAAAKTLAKREAAVLAREQIIHLREKALRAQEEAVKTKAEHGARAEAQLREANENLVVATVRAQTMTEFAEGTTAQMSYMAEHDFLTGLPNRSLLTDRLAQSIGLARRHGKNVALMYLDLDHFKHINDSLGHAVGDQLLQSIAKRLQECVRHSDTVCRQGGDEFVVLLSELNHAEDAALSAEKIIESLLAPHRILEHDLDITASIGISIFPNDGEDAETLIKSADTAMYHAKENGRNNYQFFSRDMTLRAVERQAIESDLRRALERQEFVLHYQPKINLETGAITGVEALVRWRHPNRGLLLPVHFISIAEDCGLIVPIGRWVLREACTQAKAWLDAGLPPVGMAVNISAVEFRSKGFLESIFSILADTRLEPRYLELELTESVLMRNTASATSLLHSLKRIGVRLAVDDFGTGYSSLSYLKQFPIDTLKIDQSFVHDVAANADDATILSAVISMGRGRQQRVIAEGIETWTQLAFLQSQHCNEGQGYYFRSPMPAEDFGQLLATAVPSRNASLQMDRTGGRLSK